MPGLLKRVLAAFRRHDSKGKDKRRDVRRVKSTPAMIGRPHLHHATAFASYAPPSPEPAWPTYDDHYDDYHQTFTRQRPPARPAQHDYHNDYQQTYGYQGPPKPRVPSQPQPQPTVTRLRAVSAVPLPTPQHERRERKVPRRISMTRLRQPRRTNTDPLPPLPRPPPTPHPSVPKQQKLLAAVHRWEASGMDDGISEWGYDGDSICDRPTRRNSPPPPVPSLPPKHARSTVQPDRPLPPLPMPSPSCTRRTQYSYPSMPASASQNTSSSRRLEEQRSPRIIYGGDDADSVVLAPTAIGEDDSIWMPPRDRPHYDAYSPSMVERPSRRSKSLGHSSHNRRR